MGGALDINTGNPAPETPGMRNPNSAQGGGGFGWEQAAAAGGVALLNYLSGQDTNDANSAEAGMNRIFAGQQAEMSRNYDRDKTIWQSTHGYQNAVADMTKAGLNPALMFGSGSAQSGSGGGGSAASAPGNPQHMNAMGQGLSSGMQAASMINDLKNSDRQRLLTDAQSLQSVAAARREQSSARLNEIEAGPAESESAARKNRASIALANDKTDKVLEQVATSANIFNSGMSGVSKIFGKGRYNENDMLKAAKGKGVLTR